MITGIHLQLLAIVIGLVTAYMVHSNCMEQVNRLEVGHTKIRKELEEIKQKITK